jgi:hypothetical protein
MTTAAEKQHLGRVAELGCYLCQQLGYGATPAQVHHLREGVGMGQKQDAWLTVPLCDAHHANSSPDGIHGQRKVWRLKSLDEMDALSWTIKRLMT